jgi:hypothetical protein
VRIKENSIIHPIVDPIAEAVKIENTARIVENLIVLAFERSSWIFHKHMLAKTFL